MNEEAEKLRALVTKREEEARTAEKAAADLKVRADALEAQNTKLAEERDEARTALASARTELSAARDEMIEREVAALVGIKITAAEKDGQVKLAKANKPLFDELIAQRSTLPTAGRVMPPPTDNKNAADALTGSEAIVAEALKRAEAHTTDAGGNVDLSTLAD